MLYPAENADILLWSGNCMLRSDPMARHQLAAAMQELDWHNAGKHLSSLAAPTRRSQPYPVTHWKLAVLKSAATQEGVCGRLQKALRSQSPADR
jgi:hypothetical protein